MAAAGILVNLLLMLLNLLPIPPLDGGRVVTSLLPRRAAWRFAKLEPWGVPLPTFPARYGSAPIWAQNHRRNMLLKWFWLMRSSKNCLKKRKNFRKNFKSLIP